MYKVICVECKLPFDHDKPIEQGLCHSCWHKKEHEYLEKSKLMKSLKKQEGTYV